LRKIEREQRHGIAFVVADFQAIAEVDCFHIPPIRKLNTALGQCVVKYANQLKMA